MSLRAPRRTGPRGGPTALKRAAPSGKKAAAPGEIVADGAELARRCRELRRAPFVCVDTEFLREKTFWPILCLVQVSGPDGPPFAVDALAKGIDLSPLESLLNDASPVKVFHAARQDVEIFFHRTGKVPKPLFDTQVAAMACGYGESVGYEVLVREIAGAEIDKADRFTDWSRRPLTATQVRYALGDVLHLPKVYLDLKGILDKEKRGSWVEEEMAQLRDAANYRLDPADAWRRAKLPKLPARAAGVARALAAAREEIAQKIDRPRRWIVRDEVLVQIARTAPETREALASVRGVSDRLASGSTGRRLLQAVREGLEADPPERGEGGRPRSRNPGLAELLKVLLRQCAAENRIAPRLIASSADLERIAAGDDGVPAFQGWRDKVFGKRARELRGGKIGLAVRGGRVGTVRVD